MSRRDATLSSRPRLPGSTLNSPVNGLLSGPPASGHLPGFGFGTISCGTAPHSFEKESYMKNFVLVHSCSSSWYIYVASFVRQCVRGPASSSPGGYRTSRLYQRRGARFSTRRVIFAVHDSQWVAIPFWRSPECVPPDFNLLDQVDAPGAFGCQLLVEGFVRLERETFSLMSWEARGVGDVPIWFVSWQELQTSMSDGR